MEPQQDAFDFPDESEGSSHALNLRGRYECHGRAHAVRLLWQRMPSALLDTTPPSMITSGGRYHAPYHAPTCRWIESRGLRLNEERSP